MPPLDTEASWRDRLVLRRGQILLAIVFASIAPMITADLIVRPPRMPLSGRRVPRELPQSR